MLRLPHEIACENSISGLVVVDRFALLIDPLLAGCHRASSNAPAPTTAPQPTWLSSTSSPPALAMTRIQHCRRLTIEIDELAGEIGERVQQIAPSLLAIVGCAAWTAAKIIGETAAVDRFRSKDAFARHNGSAPLPFWSSNRARHRLSRTGNRQLNAALHRIALTQARCDPDARAPLARRKAKGRRRHGGAADPQMPTLRRRLPRHDRRPGPPISRNSHRCLTEEQICGPA
ncbi:IS110 family transposase [Nocardia beijingensis]|uniref:IS110 family transposase n=1 Tax=Nocardia beijingensis TaxID=95162 RepID=UPI003323EA80